MKFEMLYNVIIMIFCPKYITFPRKCDNFSSLKITNVADQYDTLNHNVNETSSPIRQS